MLVGSRQSYSFWNLFRDSSRESKYCCSSAIVSKCYAWILTHSAIQIYSVYLWSDFTGSCLSCIGRYKLTDLNKHALQSQNSFIFGSLHIHKYLNLTGLLTFSNLKWTLKPIHLKIVSSYDFQSPLELFPKFRSGAAPDYDGINVHFHSWDTFLNLAHCADKYFLVPSIAQKATSWGRQISKLCGQGHLPNPAIASNLTKNLPSAITADILLLVFLVTPWGQFRVLSLPAFYLYS